ncbi:TFIIB-type zinc ribbon-containing protein, partial [Streptomyces albidoflavus]|uniref:TFIIB-type zinc ribbon-containing protein n=1 Tax=Streptomyces albidoflavus TaxID=1886 RepID=UPI00211CD5C8
MHCPKCHAPMHTYNRNGVQIEQCGGCRGIFLDWSRRSWPHSGWTRTSPPSWTPAPGWPRSRTDRPWTPRRRVPG